jgi:DNA-binding CsgD family transcriptional regulator
MDPFMFLLPHHLQQLFKKKKTKGSRRFESDASAPALARPDGSAGGEDADAPDSAPAFEVFPADPAIRGAWFSLTIREREVIALICMGHRNYEVASMLGIEYGTVQTHLQNIFHKFQLRSRKEIRAALQSWRAEEWWTIHHR